MKQRLGLYVHVPFCKEKCSYCDFNSNRLKEGEAELYLKGVQAELKGYKTILAKQEREVDTVFIGGGTPTCLTGKQMAYLFDYCLSSLPLRPGAEITVEANPDSINEEKAMVLARSNVNRVSIGLQAWQNRLLKQLGRVHDRDQFLQGYHLLRRLGFTNISVDLMFGLPGQSVTDWEESLHEVAVLDPEHLSIYSLKLEEGTVLDQLWQQGVIELPSEDEEADMYGMAMDFLGGQGYQQYEISNFSREGYQCQHNLLYWHHDEYIGVGPGAHSYFNGYRYNNLNRLSDYLQKLSKGDLPIERGEYITLERTIEDSIVLGLRLKTGIDLCRLEQQTGGKILRKYKKTIDKLVGQGLVDFDGIRLRLTPKGFFLANQVFIEFITIS